MPTYDYECDACGHKFELFQSINDPVERKCPQCKKLKLRRLFGTGAAIVFKGSGFYQTDYRSESYKKAASAESGKSESKSESSSSSEPHKTAAEKAATPSASDKKSKKKPSS
jgi:putative FmdB family regulatory protein